jgi:prolipoprotein diacylglyceryltransferase
VRRQRRPGALGRLHLLREQVQHFARTGELGGVAAVPGARLDSTLERDPQDSTLPVYRRRWTVWDAGVSSSGAAAKIVAVSVVYRERTIATPREVVLYVHSEIRGNFMANINAFN